MDKVSDKAKQNDTPIKPSKESRLSPEAEDALNDYQSGYKPEIDKQQSQSFFKSDGLRALPWWIKLTFLVIIMLFVAALVL